VKWAAQPGMPPSASSKTSHPDLALAPARRAGPVWLTDGRVPGLPMRIPPDSGERRAGREAEDRQQRKGLYFTLMGICVGLCVLAWALIRMYSLTAAIVMSGVALVLPLIAVTVANADYTSGNRRPR
jgi:hypothetical protein